MLHSTLVWLVVLPATAVLGLAAVAAARLPGRRWWSLHLARSWARVCLLAGGCRLQVEGLGNITPECHYVVMANHRSALDIPVLLAALPVSLRLSFWAKQSLFSVPFLGWAMAAMGFIAIDREQRSNAAGMFASSLQLSRQGRSFLIFPEETYSFGESLLPFQRGGFLLALKTGLPILPVGIAGTSHALPPDHHVIQPTRLTVRVGAPITTESLPISRRRHLTETTRRAITELSGCASP